MSYVAPNFKTKKALKEAIAAGKRVEVYQPGLGTVPMNGKVYLEGPHYPEPHRWYAEGTMENGELVEVEKVRRPSHDVGNQGPNEWANTRG